ncbi:MAG: cyclic-di-AMP receptor [Bacillota bacterium]|nr:cyclic-di-AMP receptor [Bacillota bacterium]
MKLIIAVVQDMDWPGVTDALVKRKFRVTRASSTGGFLRRGNTTLLVGVEDSMVESAIAIIRDACKPREAYVAGLSADSAMDMPISVMVGGATILVVNVERYERV